MQIALFMVFLSILFMGLIVLRNKLLLDKHFKLKFKKFNENRFNPVTIEQYKSFYQIEYNPVNFLGTMIYLSIKNANHRDGDELISNSKRDAKTRIKDHLKLDKQPKNSILSLGYEFKNKDNFIKFITILEEVLPVNSSLSFPINKEWFILAKSDKNIGISYKMNSF